MVFFSSDFSKENIPNKMNKNIIFSEYFDESVYSLFNQFNPEYFYINNKILYQKNKEISDEWKKFEENIKIIQNKITSSKGALINNDKLYVLNTIFSDKGKSLSLSNKLEKYSKKDLLFIINLLINCEINNEISKIIFYLYNKISERKIEIKFDDKVARLVKDKNLNNILLMFSKVKFKNLQDLYCRNCELTDNNLSLLKNLFSDSLVELDLSNNQISDITIFSEVKNLVHLKKLNLSNNKISDVSCLKNDLNYKDLEHLDLSSNQIEKMSKISIPSLRYLTIMNMK